MRKNKLEKEKKTDCRIEYCEAKPISAWGYVGYSFLWSFVPVIGQILWIISCFSKKNVNVRNYARSFVCAYIVMIAVYTVLTVALVVLIMTNVITPDMITENGGEIVAQLIK